MEHQPWREHGKCASLKTTEVDQLFFIGRGKSPKPAQTFCAGCPVRKPCLFYALFYDEAGIWAGTTEEERRNLKPFLMAEVAEAMVLTFQETHSIDAFLPKRESVDQSGESSGWYNERLVS